MATPRYTKVIVTNLTALKTLYGNNYTLVANAITALITADAARNIVTTVVYLDALPATMQAPSVTIPSDSKQNKDAIDAVVAYFMPNYVTILGGPDVVAQQQLNNPTGDGDAVVPSDLPYASTSPYSARAADFINATRIVGRIPGITGIADPTALVNALGAAATITARPVTDYNNYLGISAAVWQNSTSQSLTNIFGNAADLHLSPADGPNWTNALLAALSHFVNCHGANNSPNWFGQNGNLYPIAENATQVDGKLQKGTIAAAECCYGAQLYNPGNAHASLCNTYLSNKAAAFCGSTTIAYGPAAGQGSADLITRDFMINLRAGATGGTALLQARQTYVASHPILTAIDIKTLAQFYLLGDSSCQPVTPVQNLAKVAPVSGTSQPAVSEADPTYKPTDDISKSLAAIATATGMQNPTYVSCPVLQPYAKSPGTIPDVIYLIFENPTAPSTGQVNSARVQLVSELSNALINVETQYRKS